MLRMVISYRYEILYYLLPLIVYILSLSIIMCVCLYKIHISKIIPMNFKLLGIGFILQNKVSEENEYVLH